MRVRLGADQLAHLVAQSGELETEDPTELLHRLTSEALAQGRRLEGLSVSRPTLEDVYLELTAGEGEE